MQITTTIDPSLKEESAQFRLRRMTPRIGTIINLLTATGNQLWCYHGSRLVPVPISDIYYLEVDQNAVAVHLADRQLVYRGRLHQVTPQLDPDFVEASRSAVFNYRKIDHLELQGNGTIDVVLKNSQRLHIARRKIKQLQERLGL